MANLRRPAVFKWQLQLAKQTINMMMLLFCSPTESLSNAQALLSLLSNQPCDAVTRLMSVNLLLIFTGVKSERGSWYSFQDLGTP